MYYVHPINIAFKPYGNRTHPILIPYLLLPLLLLLERPKPLLLPAQLRPPLLDLYVFDVINRFSTHTDHPPTLGAIHIPTKHKNYRRLQTCARSAASSASKSAHSALSPSTSPSSTRTARSSSSASSFRRCCCWGGIPLLLPLLRWSNAAGALGSASNKPVARCEVYLRVSSWLKGA